MRSSRPVGGRGSARADQMRRLDGRLARQRPGDVEARRRERRGELRQGQLEARPAALEVADEVVRGAEALLAHGVADRVRRGALDLQRVGEEDQRLVERAAAQRLPACAFEIGDGLVGVVGARPVMGQQRVVRGQLVLGVGALAPFGHRAVQLAALALGQQVVGDLARDLVAEEIGQLGILRLAHRQVEPGEGLRDAPAPPCAPARRQRGGHTCATGTSGR